MPNVKTLEINRNIGSKKTASRFIVFFPLTVFALLISFSAVAQNIKLMTFNIYHAEQSENKGKSSLQEIAEIIKRSKPDFVALQELDSMTGRSATLNNGVKQDLLKELAALTGMHPYFAKAIDYDGGGYGVGILSRTAGEAKVYPLPNPKNHEARVLITLSSTLPGGKKIVFAGTHLCNKYAENRIAQVEKINEILSGFKEPVILGGDLNFRPTDTSYTILSEKFLDAAAEKGNPEFTIPSDTPTARIDYIFLSKNQKWKIGAVTVLKDKPSDHLAVLVEAKL